MTVVLHYQYKEYHLNEYVKNFCTELESKLKELDPYALVSPIQELQGTVKVLTKQERLIYQTLFDRCQKVLKEDVKQALLAREGIRSLTESRLFTGLVA